MTVPTVGYNARKLRQWLRLTGGVPSRTGKDPVGQMLFLKHERPEVYEAAARVPRAHGLPQPAPHRPGRGLLRHHRGPLGHRQPRPGRASATTTSSIEWVGVDRAKLPELVPTGSIIGPLSAEAARRAGPGRHGAGRRRHRRHRLGRHRLGRRARLRGPPLHRHLVVAVVPRAVQEDRHPVQHHLAAVGHPRPLLGGHRAGHRRQVPDLADRQPALPRRRPRRRAPRPDDVFERLNELAAGAAPGSGNLIFLPWLNGERTPVDDHHLRGGWFNASLATGRRRPGALGARGRGPEHPVDEPGHREVHQAALRAPQLRRAAAPAPTLWCQILADVLDRPIRQVADPVLANARGAGLLGLGGAGPPALGRHTVADRRSSRPSSPTPPTGPPTTGCSTPSSTSTRRTRASTPSSTATRDSTRHDRRPPPMTDPTDHRARCPSRPSATTASSYETFAAIPATGPRPRRGAGRDARPWPTWRRPAGRRATPRARSTTATPTTSTSSTEVYALNSQANPLHTDLWPSAVKYESEIVAMTASMLGGAGIGDGPGTDTGVVRHGVVGGQREHPAGHEDLPRPRPGHPGHHRARR